MTLYKHQTERLLYKQPKQILLKKDNISPVVGGGGGGGVVFLRAKKTPVSKSNKRELLNSTASGVEGGEIKMGRGDRTSLKIRSGVGDKAQKPSLVYYRVRRRGADPSRKSRGFFFLSSCRCAWYE